MFKKVNKNKNKNGTTCSRSKYWEIAVGKRRERALSKTRSSEHVQERQSSIRPGR